MGFKSLLFLKATIRLSALTVSLSLLSYVLCSAACSGSHHSQSISDCVQWHHSITCWQHICLHYIWLQLSLTFLLMLLLKFLESPKQEHFYCTHSESIQTPSLFSHFMLQPYAKIVSSIYTQLFANLLKTKKWNTALAYSAVTVQSRRNANI